MTAYLFLNHLLNFIAPAAVVAALVVMLPRLFFGFFKTKSPLAHSWYTQAAIIFVAGCGILAGGLLIFGRDGKMVTYAALVLGAAVCQWVLIRGWKA